jgi:hypothetical protein
MVAEATPPAAAAGEMEITKNPALLVSPAMKAGEVTVHGVKLGDAIDKIPTNLVNTREDIPERPQDIIFVGTDASYFAHAGKVYRIRIAGDLLKQVPTYDAVRLQVAMGKADDIAQSPSGEEARLNFYARHVLYTVHAYRALAVVVAVDLYAP